MSVHSDSPSQGAPILPIGSVLTGLAFFCLMDVTMKSLSISLGAYNAILWRVLLALGLVSILYLARRPKMPAGPTLKIHLQRGIITVFMAFLFFWALIHVPIAEAVALSFIAPIIALYLAAVFLGETIHRNAIFASVLGLAGVVVIGWGKMSGDYTDEELLGFGAVLLSALLYAANLVIQRSQALLADPIEISFFQNLVVGVSYGLVAPFLAVVPDVQYAPEFLAAALLSIISALFIAWGYARAQAQVLINLEYSAFVWAAIFGWVFFSEPVKLPTILGTVLIVAGCILATRRGRPVAHVETTAI
ncbi:DMT family transporter [Sphingorhabdus sp. EL138]|uniref:DMT family transporter n=1 Tax=Sphingorhabdus sp. EL138 TaxID=2073156 RepID=UPI000D690217|nr:DMT family transporter [Sphingorhabdus sp. EL138]